MDATIVTFPTGSLVERARVIRAVPAGDGHAIILDRTPFHPVDHTWPDQPGDHGVLAADGVTVRVTDTVMAATEDGQTIVLGADIPVRRGTDGWTWLVASLTDEAVAEGTEVEASVDAARRAALSRGHTACHLASLALDAAVADLWRKETGTDALGNPDFEGRANQTSFIHPDGSVDEYRLGKSLRKAGFDTETFGATLADREAAANARLQEWVASGARSWIDVDGEAITDRRRWHCALPEGEAEILCGGTHVDALTAFASITVSLELTDPQTFVMTTTATPA